MSKPRTTRRPASAKQARSRRTASSVRAHCAMPACESPRVAGKAFCSTHARQARERLRVAAGDAAWA
jgi:molybdopterin biosynthesis enzyme